jgi:activator of HSP90 ATPase
MKTNFEIKETLPATPNEIYEAWLDSDGHAAMTGGGADCSADVGKPFTAWDGYISGVNLKLTPGREIVQSWRTSEFEDDDADSEVTVRLAAVEGGTEITLIHKDIPEGQPDYEQGWKDHYLEPMREYFGSR